MKYKGYLIDLDGTMYRGKEKIQEAVDFVNELKKRDIPYLFVTNNSANTRDQVTERLQKFGVPATPEHVFTSSMATAEYIKRDNKTARVFMIGERGLQHAIEQCGFDIVDDENVDYVVMGIDRGLTYQKLETACLAVRKGATLLSTNKDVAFPTDRGFVPGNGALTSVVSVSTGVDPIFIGKPEAIIMELAMQQLNLPKEDVLMIGDNYDTDILAGMNAGLDTLLVYTGVTTSLDQIPTDKQPTYTIDSLDLWELNE
ncbi:TIGR01457 family HAD-type hydrolase [Pseudalkalibacillus berkeleyi]|uniref:Acid sugar phosphatase n=1 Tax=Pseudalkalibacillus berkeleyi TaxID=1069813 RepID=A0ABS9H3P8_9BACL|nr:TIGR01457 family HAD-type hydrolase [Pseudalkalibacillus berkeleyi]MCF6138539.1 TIGR01457 family HAD-type hydrolase [Pseudalkalibacillus berkeleyi]